MTDLGDDRGQEAAVPADGAAALEALSDCLRFLANGWALHPTERAACLAILDAGMPDLDPADLQAAAKLLASSGRLTGRQREKASEQSLRLSAIAESLRSRS